MSVPQQALLPLKLIALGMARTSKKLSSLQRRERKYLMLRGAFFAIVF